MRLYREFAIELAQQAGAIILANFSLTMTKEWKADKTPVTETDLAINKIVVEAVEKEYPGYRVLGEEQSGGAGEAEFVWVVDPVDGTIPFSHGIPTSTFTMALTQNGESILGLAYDPFQDRLFFAEKGKGAELNGKPIHVSQKPDLNLTAANVEWWYSAPYNLSRLSGLLGNSGVKVLTLCSNVYGAVLVASGSLVAAVFPGTTAWDMAAAKIIIEEAGGRVTDFQGNDQRYDQKINGGIMTNGLVHDQVMELINQSLS